MRFIILCIRVCILVQVDPIYSAAALNNTEWRLDYTSGDGVLVDSANKILERTPLQEVSNLRVSENDPKLVLGDCHYTRKNGQQTILTFQSNLESHKASHQDDEILEFRVSTCRYCFFVDKVYHLPSLIISITPYVPLSENATYSDIKVDEASLSVVFMHESHYSRPLDSSRYVHSRRLTAPIQRIFLRYKYADERRECYPIHHVTALHEGYEFLNKEIVSTQPTMYMLVKSGSIDCTNIATIVNNRVLATVIEEWLRPNIKVPIQLSRRIELPITIETSYDHDDANLRSTKVSKSCVQYQSNTLIISQTSEIILYSAMFARLDLTKTLNYRRPGGSIYIKKPTSFKDDGGDNGFELL